MPIRTSWLLKWHLLNREWLIVQKCLVTNIKSNCIFSHVISNETMTAYRALNVDPKICSKTNFLGKWQLSSIRRSVNMWAHCSTFELRIYSGIKFYHSIPLSHSKRVNQQPEIEKLIKHQLMVRLDFHAVTRWWDIFNNPHDCHKLMSPINSTFAPKE